MFTITLKEFWERFVIIFFSYFVLYFYNYVIGHFVSDGSQAIEFAWTSTAVLLLLTSFQLYKSLGEPYKTENYSEISAFVGPATFAAFVLPLVLIVVNVPNVVHAAITLPLIVFIVGLLAKWNQRSLDRG